jgi:hypothetical protein
MVAQQSHYLDSVSRGETFTFKLHLEGYDFGGSLNDPYLEVELHLSLLRMKFLMQLILGS